MTADARHDDAAGLTLGIVVAIPQEARAIKHYCCAYMQAPPGENGVLLEISGVGGGRAAAGAQRLITAGANALLSWGTAAGLQPGFSPGALLLPESVIAQDGEILGIDQTWHRRVRSRLLERLDVVVQPLAESGSVLRTPADKQALHDATGAAAADMESGALARAARRAGIPFLIIRAIADPASGTIPDTVTAAIGDAGEVRVTKLLGSLLLRPHQWPQLMQLSRWFGAAQDTLMEAAKCTAPFMLANEEDD